MVEISISKKINLFNDDWHKHDTSVTHARCKLCNVFHEGRLGAVESHYKGKKHLSKRTQSSVGNTNVINSYLRPTAAPIDTRTSST